MLLTTSENLETASTANDDVLPDQSRSTSLGRVIATARLAVAAGCLVALFVDPADQPFETAARVLLVTYGVYAALIAALAWHSGFSSRRWQIIRHIVDVITFAVLNFFMAGASSPFFMSFVFVIICAALLFSMRAVIVSSLVILAIYVAIAIAGEQVFYGHTDSLQRFIARICFLLVIAALVAVMKAYQDDLQAQSRKLAAWPRSGLQDLRTLGREMLEHCADLLRVPRLVIAWQDVELGLLHVLIRQPSEMRLSELPRPGKPIVPDPRPLRSFAFSSKKGSWTAARLDTNDAGFHALEANPVDPDFRAQHHIDAVFAASFSGQMVSGWIFALDREGVTSDDLVIAEVLAGLVAARLDHYYLSEQLRASALTQERIRFARDLHDGVLQSLSGAAVHVHLFAQLARKDPGAAATMAGDVEQALLADQRELRSLIAQLRSAAAATEEPKLSSRVEGLAQRIEREWGIKTDIEISPIAEIVAPGMADEVFRLLKEAVTNAAMHSFATRVRAEVTVHGNRVHVTVEDNGRGFAFTGRYDLARLKEMKRGPVTLKERVASLDGELIIESTPRGSRVEIQVPMSLVEVSG
jgi:signal transduction histidine kinase